MVWKLGYGLDDRGLEVRFPTGLTDFHIFHNIKTGSGNQQASYPMGTRGGGHEANHFIFICRQS
jgi:hypothetical protein